MADAGVRYGPTALTGTSATLGTVGAATTLTIRNIHICNETSAGVLAVLSIGTDGAGKRILGPNLNIPANSVYDWSGFMIVAATEIITGWASVASSLTITVSGILTT